MSQAQGDQKKSKANRASSAEYLSEKDKLRVTLKTK